MSARDTYQPHVSIDGVQLSESARLYGLTPIADLQLKWGATDWWGNVEPSTAYLQLLDPLGELLNVAKGAQITITADPDGRVMFKGTLDTSTATYGRRLNTSGKRVPVWIIDIDASDPLLQLAADRNHGPNYPARNGQVNRLHWGRSSISERNTDLQQRSATPIVFKYTNWMALLDDTLAPQGDYPVLPYTLQQNVSVLTVLRKTARIEHPLNRPFYDHSRDQIRLLRPPSASTMPAKNATLTTVGGRLVMNRAVSTVPPVELDARQLLADGGELRLDLKEYENARRFILKDAYTILRPADTAAGIYGTHYEVTDGSQPRTFTAGIGDGSTVELETDMIFTQNPNIPADVYASIPTLMQATDQWRKLPGFSFSVRHNDPLPASLAALFRAAPAYNEATDVITPQIIVGSPLQWAGTMPAFAVVGGELRYTDAAGWLVSCVPVPVPTQPVTGTTLGDITSTAPISSFADRYMVGDLQLL